MIAKSADRVSDRTTDASNARIRRQIEANLAFYAQRPELIEQRLRELDEEWDIERVLETGSSTLTLTGLLLAIARDRKWLILSLAVQGFFMQHALQGWCPPLPLFRGLGVRTADEINHERYALKALRGDFRDVAPAAAAADSGGAPQQPVDPQRALEAVRS